MSQEMLAEQSGLSVRGISDLERGLKQRPRPETVRMLADALHLPPDARTALIAAGTPRHALNLPPIPQPFTPLIGRDDDVEEVAAMLEGQPAARMVTLIGPGGVGKTRLALALASRLNNVFPDGVAFVPFAGLSDDRLVVSDLATALGIREFTHRNVLDVLATHLRDRRLLVVMDNLEQLLPAAADIAGLLANCRGMSILATSRAPLNISGERRYPVRPLPVPAAGQLVTAEVAGAAPAIQLFVQRVHAFNSAFAITDANARAVTEVCRSVDGLPLAVELAAVRMKTLSIHDLRTLLDQSLDLLTGGPVDSPDRHRTMRATISWSHGLLSAGDQRAFRRFAVFASGATIDAVEAVIAPGDRIQTIRHVEALVDQSLVQWNAEGADEARYTMPETIRAFALERLAASGEEATVRDRHARWFMALTEASEAERTGTSPPTGRINPGLERNNILAGLQWLQAQGEIAAALRFASALWPLWLELGDVSEGRVRLSALLAEPTASVEPTIRAGAMAVAAVLAQAQGDHSEATSLSQQALAVFNDAGDQRGAAVALTTLGLDAMIQGENQRAENLLNDALTRFKSVNDPRAGTWVLRHLSSVAFRAGDVGRAATLADEGLNIARVAGTQLDVARLLLNVAYAALLRGNLEHARLHYQEALDLFEALRDRWGEADALMRLGQIALEQGRSSEAMARLHASQGLFQEIRDPEGTVVALVLQGWIHRAQGDHDSARARAGESLALARHHHNPSRIVSALTLQGTLDLDRGDRIAAAAAWQEGLRLSSVYHDPLGQVALMELTARLSVVEKGAEGARLLGAAAAVRDTHQVPVPASMRQEQDDLAASLHSALGAGYDAAFAVGAKLPIAEAVSAAMRLLGMEDASGS